MHSPAGKNTCVTQARSRLGRMPIGMLHGTGAMDLAAAPISKEEEILTGRTVTPPLTVSLLQKATSSSVLPSDSSGLQANLGLAKGGRKHNFSVFFTHTGR